MAMELGIRFLTGGIVVSLFAILGDMLRPKTFAGLFGAAPSVALATLGLAFWSTGGAYVAVEGRSMLAGAVALGLSAIVATPLLRRLKLPALAAAAADWAAWGAVAAALWAALLR
jgi:hypothetical protein